mgnify:CR=1 FL=1
MKKIILFFITFLIISISGRAQDVLGIDRMNTIYKKDHHLNKKVQEFFRLFYKAPLHEKTTISL